MMGMIVMMTSSRLLGSLNHSNPRPLPIVFSRKNVNACPCFQDRKRWSWRPRIGRGGCLAAEFRSVRYWAPSLGPPPPPPPSSSAVRFVLVVSPFDEPLCRETILVIFREFPGSPAVVASVFLLGRALPRIARVVSRTPPCRYDEACRGVKF